MSIERVYKGKSLISNPNDFIVLDIETTGFNPNFDKIIEISAIKVIDSIPVEIFSTLINPECPIGMSSFLTGITDKMVVNSPKIYEVLDSFINFIQDYPLLGYNISFDVNFLYDNILLYKDMYLKNDFIDLLRFSRKLFPNLPNHKLETISEYLSFEKQKHRALADCSLCIDVYNYCLNEINDKYKNFDNFKKLFDRNYKYKRTYNKENSFKEFLKTLQSQVVDFDTSNPLYDKKIVFTGKLERFLRKEASQIVVNLGGIVKDSVTKDIDFLVLGNNDLCKTLVDGKSNKHKKAEELILKGFDIKILIEDTFYDYIEDNL